MSDQGGMSTSSGWQKLSHEEEIALVVEWAQWLLTRTPDESSPPATTEYLQVIQDVCLELAQEAGLPTEMLLPAGLTKTALRGTQNGMPSTTETGPSPSDASST